MVDRHPAVVAISAVLKDASAEAGAPITDITVETLDAQEWPDGCLGLSQPGEGCTDAIVPGYRIELGKAAAGFVYRTNQGSEFRREGRAQPTETLFVRFTRSGGLIGRPTTREFDTATMPKNEAEELAGLVNEAKFWDLPKQIDNGAPVADGFSYTVWANIGRRNNEVNSYDGTHDGTAKYPGLAALIGWLSQRTPSTSDIPVDS